MVLDDEIQGAELDELQRLASELMDTPSEPASATNEGTAVHSDGLDVLPMSDRDQ